MHLTPNSSSDEVTAAAAISHPSLWAVSDRSQRVTLAMVLSLLLAVSLPIKFAMFNYLRKNQTPINTLIAVEQGINSFFMPGVVLQIVELVTTEPLGGEREPNVVCAAHQMLIMLVVFYYAFGGLGIAIMRLLYIHAHHFLLRVGIHRCMRIICASCFALVTLCFSIIALGLTLPGGDIRLENYYYYNACMKKPRFGLGQTSTSHPSKVVISCLMAANLTEFTAYVAIFGSRFQWNKMASSTIFANQPHVTHLRQRRNAISASGHLVSWLVELLVYVTVCSFWHTDNFSARHTFMYLVPAVYLTVFPGLQTICSDVLRSEFRRVVVEPIDARFSTLKDVFSIRGVESRCSDQDQDDDDKEDDNHHMEESIPLRNCHI